MPLLHDHRLCGCRRAHHGAPEGFASADAPRHYPVDLRLEPYHLDINLHVDVDNARAHGTVTISVRARQGGALELELDAVDLKIEQVCDPQVDGVTWSYDGAKLKVSWAQPFVAGEERDVAVTYAVEHPRSGLFFSAPTADNPDAPRYAATDHETERARHWLPCIDRPEVRCTLDFRLRAASALTILANGELVDEQDHGDGTRTARWRLDWRCPSYITCFAIGDFTRADDGEFDGKPIAYFGSHHKRAEDLQRSFGRTGEMLTWMTQKLGQPFPFPKYYQFALPGFGGAMENISLVSWDDIFVMDETLAKEWTWLVDQVNVHEMAHSYFGDALVCRGFAHAWLKESWATYMESCWLEHRYGEDELAYDFWRNQQAYFQEADTQYMRPIVTHQFESSWQMYDRHLYPGGGARLHMLRKFLGDEIFWAGVRDYVDQHLGQVVETDDFRKALEGRSGRSLVQFFEQWFRSPGYPHLKVTFTHDATRGLGTFSFEQAQAGGDKHLPTFTMPMAVAWTINGERQVHRFTLDRASQQVTLRMGQAPEQVQLDPDNASVFKPEFNPGDAMLRAQLSGAPDVIGRIRAAQALAKTCKRENLDALGARYAEEPFWGVREQMALAVGKVHSQHAVRLLSGWLEHEQDPLVLESLVRACGKLRDPQLRAGLIARLEAGLPYRATMAAYEALGAYGADAPMELLLSASDTTTYSDFPQTGAIRALAATRQADMAGVLTALTQPQAAPSLARAAAAGALGKLAALLTGVEREAAIDRLEDLLRDRVDRVRAAAAVGLISAGATRARQALSAYRETLSHQDQVTLDQQLRGLSAPEAPRVKTLEEQLEQLQKDYRGLMERLDKLERTPDA